MNISKLLLIALLMRTTFAMAQPIQPTPLKLELKVTLDPPQTAFLRGESVSETAVTVMVENTGEQSATVTDLDVAAATGDLKIGIVGPKGEQVPRQCHLYIQQIDKPLVLKVACETTITRKLKHFGYDTLDDVGEHAVQIEFKPRPGTPALLAESMKIMVIDAKESDILSTHVVKGSNLNDYDIAMIQQIVVDGKTCLYERISLIKDGKIDPPHRCTRLAELPGKVFDLKVQGVYGSREPLTITYRETTYTKWTTTHVINSVDGRPWTAAEEKHRQEKLKRDAKPPADKK